VAKRIKLSLADALTVQSQQFTQRELAKRYRISTRTIRRWKNEGGTPAAFHDRVANRILKDGRATRRRMVRQHGEAIPPGVAVPPPIRRITRIDPSDPKRKRRVASDTLEADTEKLRADDLLQLLIGYRDRANRRGQRAGFRFTVFMQVQFESGGVTRAAHNRTMLEWQEFNDWSNGEVWEYIEETLGKGRIIGVRLLDPRASKKAPRPVRVKREAKPRKKTKPRRKGK